MIKTIAQKVLITVQVIFYEQILNFETPARNDHP